MTVLSYTPKAADLPNPNRSQQGSYAEIDVPGDYEVKLESFQEYDKSDKGGTKGWIFQYSCETPSGGSVPFDVYIPFSQMWKVVQHFNALGSPSEDGVPRQYDPNEVVGNTGGAHIDFPRDNTGEPTSKYREIRLMFPIPEDEEIEAAATTPVPEEVEAL